MSIWPQAYRHSSGRYYKLINLHTTLICMVVCHPCYDRGPHFNYQSHSIIVNGHAFCHQWPSNQQHFDHWSSDPHYHSAAYVHGHTFYISINSLIFIARITHTLTPTHTHTHTLHNQIKWLLPYHCMCVCNKKNYMQVQILYGMELFKLKIVQWYMFSFIYQDKTKIIIISIF